MTGRGRRLLIVAFALLALVTMRHVVCFGRSDGQTALMSWSKEGWTPLVQMLLVLGADPNAPYVDETRNSGVTALSFAAANGRAGATRALLRWGANPNIIDGKGFTPLCEALKFGGADPGTVSLLLAGGARVDFPDSDHSALGCLPPAKWREKDVPAMLFAHGAKADDRYLPGKPIFVVAGRCCHDKLSALLDRGASVNMRSDEGRTALMEASTYGRVENVRLLLSHGADPTLSDNSGKTALALAQEGLALSDPDGIRRLDWNPNDPRREPAFREVVALMMRNGETVPSGH